VVENAKRLRRQKDDTQYSLQLDKFRQWNRAQDAEAGRYENIFKPIDQLNITNLAEDMSQIQSDTSRVARNTDWIKDRKKDIQLYETMRIIQDMIRIDGVAAVRKD
jgi:carboxyl-terminal processing protease